MQLNIVPGIKTTLEEFVKEEGLDLDSVIEKIENEGTYYEPDYDLYSIEKEDDYYVLTFGYDTLGFLDFAPGILKKYNHNLLFFQEVQYNGNMMGSEDFEYVEWEYEYSSKSFKLDIPRLLFKMQNNPFIVRRNDEWINDEEENRYNDLIDNGLLIDGKYTRNGIISLDDFNEENWYQKLQSIGYSYDFPKEKPEKLLTDKGKRFGIGSTIRTHRVSEKVDLEILLEKFNPRINSSKKKLHSKKDKKCNKCMEETPSTFDTCWHCGSSFKNPSHI